MRIIQWIRFRNIRKSQFLTICHDIVHIHCMKTTWKNHGLLHFYLAGSTDVYSLWCLHGRDTSAPNRSSLTMMLAPCLIIFQRYWVLWQLQVQDIWLTADDPFFFLKYFGYLLHMDHSPDIWVTCGDCLTTNVRNYGWWLHNSILSWRRASQVEEHRGKQC